MTLIGLGGIEAADKRTHFDFMELKVCNFPCTKLIRSRPVYRRGKYVLHEFFIGRFAELLRAIEYRVICILPLKRF